MTPTEEDLVRLLASPREAYDMELKCWIDPATTHGEILIARALLALRNNDGGFLVIGFDNKTASQTTDSMPQDVRKVFHHDAIQWIVSKYCTDPFPVVVHFVEQNGIVHPMIQAPGGLKKPAVCKSAQSDGQAELK